MKIYISGKISGLPFPEVKAKFQAAQDFLEDLGFEVISPTKNGLSESHTWEQHMGRDVELLLSCEAIYMLDGWIDSTGSCIEYDIAMRTQKDILFESCVIQKDLVLKIKKAIHEVTGMKFSEYTTVKCRKMEKFFARMLFVYNCRKIHLNLTEIVKYFYFKNHTSISYMLKKYKDEINYNPQFRKMAQKVESILNQANNEA